MSFKPFNIIGVGNSLMVPMLDQLAILRPQDTIVQVGRGGLQTYDIIHQFDTLVLAFKSSTLTNVCLFHESIDSMNDGGVTPADELIQLKQISTLCANNGLLSVTAGAIPAEDPPADPNLVFQLANLILTDYSWANAISRELPFAPQWVPAGSNQNPTYYIDGVHLTTAGAAVFASYMNIALNTLSLGASISGAIGGLRFVHM